MKKLKVFKCIANGFYEQRSPYGGTFMICNHCSVCWLEQFGPLGSLGKHNWENCTNTGTDIKENNHRLLYAVTNPGHVAGQHPVPVNNLDTLYGQTSLISLNVFKSKFRAFEDNSIFISHAKSCF